MVHEANKGDTVWHSHTQGPVKDRVNLEQPDKAWDGILKHFTHKIT
jgi:hypothetical protein